MYPCVACGQVFFLLVSWSVICCQDDCYHGLAKGALPEEYLKVTILTSTAWEDTRLIWCLFYPGAWRQRGFSPESPRATQSRPNSGDFFFVDFFSKFELRQQKSDQKDA